MSLYTEGGLTWLLGGLARVMRVAERTDLLLSLLVGILSAGEGMKASTEAAPTIAAAARSLEENIFAFLRRLGLHFFCGSFCHRSNHYLA